MVLLISKRLLCCSKPFEKTFGATEGIGPTMQEEEDIWVPQPKACWVQIHIAKVSMREMTKGSGEFSMCTIGRTELRHTNSVSVAV